MSCFFSQKIEWPFERKHKKQYIPQTHGLLRNDFALINSNSGSFTGKNDEILAEWSHGWILPKVLGNFSGKRCFENSYHFDHPNRSYY